MKYITVSHAMPSPPKILCRPHRQTRLVLEDLLAGGRLTDATAHAGIDHLVHVTYELAEVKRLVEGVVL
jgi:hypothetical protein